jgi:hypothetical protein
LSRSWELVLWRIFLNGKRPKNIALKDSPRFKSLSERLPCHQIFANFWNFLRESYGSSFRYGRHGRNSPGFRPA